MDKLSAMRTFIEIVDRGSLTAAGSALGKSPPSVVRKLAALEKELGTRLLRRTTRRMSLTPEGRDYLERCRQILTDIDEAELALGAGVGELRGELTITAPMSFGQMHVGPVAAEFALLHPELSLTLLLLDRVVDLVGEGIDLAVRIAPLEDSSMIAIGVGSVKRVIVASPTLLERIGVPAHPDELPELPCVLFDGIAPGGVWRFQEGKRAFGVRVSGTFRCNQATAALEACAGGLGFGHFLSYQAEPLVRSGRLATVLTEYSPPEVPVNLVYAGGRLVSPRMRAFLDFLRNRLRARLESPT